MTERARTILLAWVLLPAHALLAQERPRGAELAAAFEVETSPRKRARLLEQVAALEPKGKASFVAWARQRRTQGAGWTALAPALAALGTPAAVSELAEVAGSNAESAEPAFQALRALPTQATLPHLVRGLASLERRAQASFAAVVKERLQADPARVLAAIQLALSSSSAEEAQRLRTMLRGLACEAVANGEPELVGAFLRLDDPIVAAGAARGAGRAALERRSAAQGGRGKAGEGERPAPEMEPVWLEAAVATLAREEPAVLVEACHALAAVVGLLEPGEPGGPWAGRLIQLLGHRDKHVSHAAWRALKHVSGVDQPQSPEAWLGYWALHRGGVEHASR